MYPMTLEETIKEAAEHLAANEREMASSQGGDASAAQKEAAYNGSVLFHLKQLAIFKWEAP